MTYKLYARKMDGYVWSHHHEYTMIYDNQQIVQREIFEEPYDYFRGFFNLEI